MITLAWPAVVALGLLLGFVVAVLALRRREVPASKAQFDAHVATFNAFTAAVEKRVAELDETAKRSLALNQQLTQSSRFPPGLRATP